MKPLYSKNQDTRLAGLERRVRFLERREQLPNPLLIDDLGGGGGLIVEAQGIGAHSTNIAAGATANLEWGVDFGGDELVTFDGLGSTTAPVFLQDGFYVMNVTVTGASITDGKGFTGYVTWAQAGTQYFEGIGISGVSQIRTGRTVAANGSATFPIQIVVHNLDSSARDFELAAVNVWRLS